MAIKGTPARFTPRGASDTLSAGDSPPGACSALTNLIFDPSTPHTFVCRPAAFQLSNFPGFNSPGIVSAGLVIGNILYGMVASNAHPGKDQPFAYNLVTNVFIAITGVTSANIPNTLAATGDWVPPIMAMAGTMMFVTHAGFPGAGVNFGWFDLTNPSAPVWNGGDTAANGIGAIPTFVAQFNNRAYFIVGNTVPFTDALTNPPTRTNASQTLLLGDSSPLTALAPLPLDTTSVGIIQALLAFKDTGIWQITGDSATSNLATNQINDSAGTASPRSVISTPDGVGFVDHDGLRFVEFSGNISDPDPDIRVPFINALFPSRISAGYNGGVLRICVQNGMVAGTPYQEWWLDLVQGAFTGPHTCRQDLALPWMKTFVIFNNVNPAVIAQSDITQSPISIFIEFGVQLAFSYQTSPIGESQELWANSATQTTINIAYSALGGSYVITAQDESGGVLATAGISEGVLGAVWGLFTWGAAKWGATQYGLSPRIIPWQNPLVFSKVLIGVTGNSGASFRIGAVKMLYKVLKYLLG